MYYNTLCYDIGVGSKCEAIRIVDMIWSLDGAESIHDFDVLPRLVAERYKDA